MELVLVRHGVAEDAGPGTGWRDEPRRLTPEGRTRMAAAARGMASIGLRPDVVLTSPLVRCRETAEIVVAAVGGELHEDPRLRPGLEAGRLLEVLLEHPDAARVLVCGHQPDMSEVAADLTGGSRVPFRKGGTAVIDVDTGRPGAALLVAVLPPRVLRALGDGAS